MSLCEGLTELSEYQKTQQQRLQELAHRVFGHMVTAFPNEPAWFTARRLWNGKILVSPDIEIASFEPFSGCFIVGVPKQPGIQHDAILNARLLLALSKGASHNRRCSPLHSSLVAEATEKLGIQVALDCTLAQSVGLNAANLCKKCSWIGGAPTNCHTKRTVWPEYVGKPLRTVVARFKKSNVKLELSPWDTLHYRPAASGVVRITYDTRSGLVVDPAPHVGNINIPDRTEYNCFNTPESNVRCIGAPLAPPPEEWRKYIGFSLMDVVDSLRARYVHAVVEYIPDSAAVGPEVRPDRIRVRFDSKTGAVTSIPTIG
jgi:hypothetical protein